MNKFTNILTKLKNLLKKRFVIVCVVLVLVLVGFLGWRLIKNKKNSQPQYQTAQVEKGTLTIIITASGQVSAANSATVDTEASGVVSKIYVENGEQVQTGDKIADIDLDLEGKQRAAQAWASYLSAKNNLDTAQTNYYTLQSEMMTKWDIYMDTAQNSTYQNADGSPKTDNRQWPEFISIDDDWLATEAKYKSQENVVKQAQTSLNSSWLSYQQTSPTVYAPISGTVTGLSLQIGSVLTAQSNTSGTSTAQKIASIKTGAAPTVQFNLSQVDTPKVKVGNPATLTFDAFPGKTYTGKIISIDTIGLVASGVTTYPAVIKLDIETEEIFSNMTATANIITQVKDDVMLVPTSAVQTQDGRSMVRVLKDGQIELVEVETGLSSSTQREIVSGLTEGDTIVVSTLTNGSTTQGQSSQTRSVFGGFGGGGGFRP